jgi:tetratricopeptide (TPR) repeat protein
MDVGKILQELDRLLAQGQLDRAELSLREYIRQAEEKGRNGALLTLYNELEGILRTTGRAEEASETADKALSLISVMGLTGTVHHATTLLNAATASRAAGKLSRALELYEAAEGIYRRLGQENSYQMAALWNNVSQVYQERNEQEKALNFLEKALKNTEKYPPEAATTRVNMALSLLALGRLDEAQTQLEEAMVYYNGDGAQNPHRAAALSAAGELAFRRGEKAQALEILQKALDITLQHFGENDACRVLRENMASIRASQ